MNVKIKLLSALGLLAAIPYVQAQSYYFVMPVKGLEAQSQGAAYTSCKAILDADKSTGDGLYAINPTGIDPFEVYCDMTTNGGGWTRVAYLKDVPIESRWNTDAWRWLPLDFGTSQGYLELSDARINAIRATASEAKQRLEVTCFGTIVFEFPGDTARRWNFRSGLRLHTGFETNYGVQNFDISVSSPLDKCGSNATSTQYTTILSITDLQLPVINIFTLDNGADSNPEKFGLKLANNPAWFR